MYVILDKGKPGTGSTYKRLKLGGDQAYNRSID
jgi:hypothetical protein